LEFGIWILEIPCEARWRALPATLSASSADDSSDFPPSAKGGE